MKNNKSSLVLAILFVTSFLFNIALVSLYLFKYLPSKTELENKLSEIYEETSLESSDCKRVYSQSARKIVCLTEPMALEMCSKNFKESLKDIDPNSLKGATIDELEKLREFIIKMCMQEKGFDY